jgi:hypothetical protein
LEAAYEAANAAWLAGAFGSITRETRRTKQLAIQAAEAD